MAQADLVISLGGDAAAKANLSLVRRIAADQIGLTGE
jgi:hypothetical protein